jgi:hypothetical protein
MSQLTIATMCQRSFRPLEGLVELNEIDKAEILGFLAFNPCRTVVWEKKITPEELNIARMQKAHKIAINSSAELYRVDILSVPIFVLITDIQIEKIVGGKDPYIPIRIERVMMIYENRPVPEHLEDLVMHVVAAFCLDSVEKKLRQDRVRRKLH